MFMDILGTLEVVEFENMRVGREDEDGVCDRVRDLDDGGVFSTQTTTVRSCSIKIESQAANPKGEEKGL